MIAVLVQPKKPESKIRLKMTHCEYCWQSILYRFSSNIMYFLINKSKVTIIVIFQGVPVIGQIRYRKWYFQRWTQNSCCQFLENWLELETIGDRKGGACETYENEVDKVSRTNYGSQDQRFILDAIITKLVRFEICLKIF